jgi:hypothetical protein
MAVIGTDPGSETLVLTEKGVAAIKEIVPHPTLQRHFQD